MADQSITWQQLLDGTRELFSRDRSRDENVEEMKQLMERYHSNRADWEQYEKFMPERYTRMLVDDGNDKYNLIVLCWGPGHKSPIHNHDESHCVMKFLSGSLKETRYEKPKGVGPPVKEHSCTVLQTDDVAYINDGSDLVHKVENPSENEGAVSLHCYFPPLRECNMYNPDTAEIKIGKMTFDNKKD